MKREDQLFLVGLVSLILSLFLFPYLAYLFPAVWLGWEYHIPSFTVDATLWIQTTFHTSYFIAFHWFFRCIMVLAVLFGAIAYFASHHISRLQLNADKLQQDARARTKLSEKAKRGSKESVIFFLKMVFIITLVFIVADIIQWAISVTPKTP